jgi:hypothetical protein
MNSGCFYYKARGYYTPDPTLTTTKTQLPDKYIIVHVGQKAWHLEDIAISEGKTEITGRLEGLPSYHSTYLLHNKVYGARIEAGRDDKYLTRPIRYRYARAKPTHEVHIYLAENTVIGNEEHASIPLACVRKMEVFVPAIGATIASHVFVTLGVIAGVVVIIGIIALATKSSCPFLYVRNGDSWQFTGEMYGGAIAAPLERDDYMPLPGLQATSGNYELKIANELKERQYTNLAELLVVDGDAGTVLADKNGRLYSIEQPVLPQSAITGGIDCRAALTSKDTSALLFDAPDAADPAFSNAVLSFARPEDAKSGRLVIKAKNSYWLDYMFARFTEQFGTGYDKFAAQQRKAPAAEGRQWSLEQGIPLSVEVQTAEGWRSTGYFDVIGPLASREMVMNVDLSRVSGKEVKIRLRCGGRFWEVDYAAMDFTEGSTFTVHRLSPLSATDEEGRDVSAALKAADNQYLAQRQAGNETIVKYAAPAQKAGNIRSVILHSRGYYEYIRHYTNKPNLARLLQFKKPGSFTRFAATEYKRLEGQKDILAMALNN